MLRSGLIVFASLALCAIAAAQSPTAAPLQFDAAKGLLNTYCGKCHAGDR